MIILKTESQVKNFVKRMTKKFNYNINHTFNWGEKCDIIIGNNKKRVLKVCLGREEDRHYATCKVMAIIKIKSC